MLCLKILVIFFVATYCQNISIKKEVKIEKRFPLQFWRLLRERWPFVFKIEASRGIQKRDLHDEPQKVDLELPAPVQEHILEKETETILFGQQRPNLQVPTTGANLYTNIQGLNAAPPIPVTANEIFGSLPEPVKATTHNGFPIPQVSPRVIEVPSSIMPPVSEVQYVEVKSRGTPPESITFSGIPVRVTEIPPRPTQGLLDIPRITGMPVPITALPQRIPEGTPLLTGMPLFTTVLPPQIQNDPPRITGLPIVQGGIPPRISENPAFISEMQRYITAIPSQVPQMTEGPPPIIVYSAPQVMGPPPPLNPGPPSEPPSPEPVPIKTRVRQYAVYAGDVILKYLSQFFNRARITFNRFTSPPTTMSIEYESK